jgi:hypothetical protein
MKPTSPSPRPSPQRRGRIVFRFYEKSNAGFIKGSLEINGSGESCPLSPWERVRVRGGGISTDHLLSFISINT